MPGDGAIDAKGSRARSIEEKLDRIIEMLENPKPYVPACNPGQQHAFSEYESWRCMWCGADGRGIMAWSARHEAAAASHAETHDAMGRSYYTISAQLGLPADGLDHVPFCSLPPDHPPGCGSGDAVHPESDAAKRYREMRS